MKIDLFTQATPHADGYRDLAPAALGPSPRDVRVIDVREPSEFDGELGHLPGAELVPLGTLEAVARAWDRSVPIVMVCRSGARSARAATALVRVGFPCVMNLEGGMIAYNAAGLPNAHPRDLRSEPTGA